MKVLLDTCIVLDYLHARDPFFDSSLNLFISVANNEFSGYLTANTLTDIYYIIHRHTHSTIESKKHLSGITQLFSILDTIAEDCIKALHLYSNDYEDAVMMETARRSGMDYIVTRNVQDYYDSPVPVMAPDEFIMKKLDRSDS